MTMLNTKSAKKDEKGIALIFTLIMLSLLLILALSFTMDSMFSQKSAYNAANSSSARFLAEAQLKQVLTLIHRSQANYDDSRVYSVDSSSLGLNTTDMLVEHLPVSSILASTDSSLTGTPKVKWNYIINASDSRIIGRTAFVVIPDDKIPLDSLVDDRVGTTEYPKHNESLNSETRIGKYVSEINVRAAISPLPDSSADIDTITDTLNYELSGAFPNIVGFTNGRYDGSWASYSSLFTAINNEITSNLSTGLNSDESKIEDSLSLVVDNDSEAFWADLDDDTELDTGELFNRFNLTRDDWSTADYAADLAFIRTQILLTPAASTPYAPTVAMEPWDGNDSDTVGFPWLAAFGYKSDTIPTLYTLAELNSTFPSVSAHRNQIAANLKDYCDDDGAAIRPTSDVSPTKTDSPNWIDDADKPTFTGNEKTPYINKIGVRVDSILTNSGSGPVTSNMDVFVKPYIGLVDIYRNAYTADVNVVVTGTVEITISLDGEAAVPYTISINSAPLTVSSATNWAVSSPGHSTFIEGTASVSPASRSVTEAAAVTAEVIVTKVTITKVVLYDDTGNNGYDYVKTLTLSPAVTFSAFSSSTVSTEYSWLGFEVNDPRQNLNAGDWVRLKPWQAPLASSTFAVTDANECNPNAGNGNDFIGTPYPARVAPNTSDPNLYDLETTADPATNLSTAFIRNAPMESPWELGFIHRGVKWQTINLKKHDRDKAIKVISIGGVDYIPGGGLYSDGDANILDQIKMTADAESPQKISIKSPAVEVFEALFSKVKYGCDIDDTDMNVMSMAGINPTTEADLSGDELDAADATAITTIGNNIINKYKVAADVNMRTRSSVVDKLLLPMTSPVIPADTDAKQEELIGKIINLTKIGSQGAAGGSGRFTIIVLAQTIKDVGGSGSDIAIWKTPTDGSAALPVPCRIGRFDVQEPGTATPGVWRDDAYGDEITSQQKIMITGTDTSTGIKITSFQYID